MQVLLKSISLNYDPDLSRTGAFHLRRNETQTVRVPEWEPHDCNLHECSPVAYRINELPAGMTIQASFEAKGGTGQSILVKAIAESSGHVLGDVHEESIPDTGLSGPVIFKLPDARAMVKQAGIGIHDIVWRWQFSPRPDIWTDFQTTRHRVYTVLARPTDPWKPCEDNPSKIHQPWTEVLNYACKWAEGVNGTVASAGDEAARLITDHVYDLGASLLKHTSDPSYAHKLFDCTGFLELLRTGVAKQIVNCEDCATIVSTFANILGCDLWQSSMGAGSGFGTNHVVQIGDRNQWIPTGFVQHTVAWKGQCLEQDLLFDAFLLVDGDDRPDAPPPVALRPSRITFGAPEERSYKFRLVFPGIDCRPTPNDSTYKRQRRELGKSYLGAAKIASANGLNRLKETYKFDSWPKARESGQRAHQENFSPSRFQREALFPDWAFHSGDQFIDAQFRSVTHLLFRKTGLENSKLLALNLYECHSSGTVNALLLQILGAFNQLTLKRFEMPLGELAFGEEGQTTIVFRYDRFIAVVGSAGRQSVNVEKYAVALYQYLQQIVENPQSKEKMMEAEQIMTNERVELVVSLKGKWRAFSISFSAETRPTLDERGLVDLENLQPNGILTAGLIIPSGTNPVAITGKVSEIGSLTQIVLNRPDGGRYEGFLTNNFAGKMIISGRYVFGPSLQFLDDGSPVPKAQSEEPWVILKP